MSNPYPRYRYRDWACGHDVEADLKERLSAGESHTSSVTVTFSIECFSDWTEEQKRQFIIEEIMGSLMADDFKLNIQPR